MRKFYYSLIKNFISSKIFYMKVSSLNEDTCDGSTFIVFAHLCQLARQYRSLDCQVSTVFLILFK